MNLLSKYEDVEIDGDKSILLFEENNHKIYWLGIAANDAFRCNVYLIQDDDEYIIVDSGGTEFFHQIKNNIEKITDLSKVTAIILCHQDPDVASSMIDWLKINPKLKIITSARTNVLLPHYGISNYDFYDIGENLEYKFKSGRILKFIEAPFLHSPGAFTTLDLTADFLFSGDIWAALDIDWKLIVDDFDSHEAMMDLFHIDYMASNIAARGFVRNIKDKKIDAILPQHGSIINTNFVKNALDYLENLECGTDVVYSDLSN